jgi:hypothetical protein
MRRDQAAELAPGGAVSLPGSFDSSLEHVTSHEGKDDGVLPHSWVLAVLREQIQQPGDFPDD